MSKFCCQIFSQMNAQWGSEIRPLNIQTCLQIGIIDDQILNGLFFKQSSCSHGPHHLKTRQFSQFIDIERENILCILDCVSFI